MTDASAARELTIALTSESSHCDMKGDQSRNMPDLDSTVIEADDDLTVETVARTLGKSPRQIQRLLKAGRLIGYKIDGPKGPQWRVKEESINLILEQNHMSIRCEELKAQVDELESALTKAHAKNESLVMRANVLEMELSKARAAIDELAAHSTSSSSALFSSADGLLSFAVDQALPAAAQTTESDCPQQPVQPAEATNTVIAVDGAHRQNWWKRMLEYLPGGNRASA